VSLFLLHSFDYVLVSECLGGVLVLNTGLTIPFNERIRPLGVVLLFMLLYFHLRVTTSAIFWSLIVCLHLNLNSVCISITFRADFAVLGRYSLVDLNVM